MIKSDPKVSIIVPAYNAENYIDATIQSVLDQTYNDWELLLIDDGSTDKTKQVIKGYLNDKRIKYFYKKNGGQGSARNMGIRMAKGPYLAFLDADDLWHAHKLQAQLSILSETGVSLVFSRVRCIDDNGVWLGRSLGSGVGMFEGFQALFLLAAGSITIPNSSVIATREGIIGAGGFNEEARMRNIEDYDMWFRMLLDGYKLYGMQDTLGAYRIHRDQNTYADPGSSLKLISYLEDLSKTYPEKKSHFEFLILQRLSMYYKQYRKKIGAKNTCLQIYFSSLCVTNYWFDKYLVRLIGFNTYLKIRRLFIRRFKRFKTFLQTIDG